MNTALRRASGLPFYAPTGSYRLGVHVHADAAGPQVVARWVLTGGVFRKVLHAILAAVALAALFCLAVGLFTGAISGKANLWMALAGLSALVAAGCARMLAGFAVVGQVGDSEGLADALRKLSGDRETCGNLVYRLVKSEDTDGVLAHWKATSKSERRVIDTDDALVEQLSR